MAVSFQHFHARPFRDSANRSESHAYQTPRQIFGHLPWNSEEQFIVVPAMQRQLQGIDSRTATSTWVLHHWELFIFHIRADSTCDAEPRQVSGKSIGEVHH